MNSCMHVCGYYACVMRVAMYLYSYTVWYKTLRDKIFADFVVSP